MKTYKEKHSDKKSMKINNKISLHKKITKTNKMKNCCDLVGVQFEDKHSKLASMYKPQDENKSKDNRNLERAINKKTSLHTKITNNF